MKNIWTIFTGDVKRLASSSIALLVAVGLCVVPALYAWFNIAASWDPYGKTGNLKVAAASADEGYTGELIPLELNAGEKLLEQLRKNDQLDWIITTPEEAVEGVRSGAYYAAVVIPEGFSRDLMSVFGGELKRAEIHYYLNEKENAIAPKVTDKGAGAIETQINETFSQTLSEVLLKALETAANLSEQADGEAVLDQLIQNLDSLRGELEAGTGTIDALTEMGRSLETVLAGISDTAAEGGETISRLGQDLTQLRTQAEDAAAALEQARTLAEGSREELQALWAGVRGQAQETFPTLERDARQGSAALTAAAEEAQVLLDRSLVLRDGLDALGLLLGADTPLLRAAWQDALGKLERIIARQTALQESLDQAAQRLEEAADRSQAALDLLSQDPNLTANAMEAARESLEEALDQLRDLINDGLDTAASVTTALEEGAQSIQAAVTESSAALESLNESLLASAESLEKAVDQAETLRDRLAAEGGDLSALLRDMVERDPAGTSAFLSAPVELESESFYPISSYGSAMAPFYSTLAIWVGGVVLSAMLKVQVSPRQRQRLSSPTESQLFLGRWLIFFLLGQVQSALICLGDLFYLQIQCQSPGRFLLCGLFTGLVYDLIIYTLAVSCGDVGKAVCVVLLVVQVAGSGGTFPVEMTPGFFHRLYPYLPFTHSMAALRECIAGFYGNTFWVELGKLGIYLPICLFAGLVLRRPIIRLNELFEEKLKDTRVM